MNQVAATIWTFAIMGGGGSGGAWLITKNSIAYLLRDTVIPANLHYTWWDKEIWSDALTQFTSDSSTDSNFKTESLKALAKETIKTKELLMNWCFKQYGVVYKSIFNRPNEDILKIRDDVSKYCKVTIGNKLGTSNQFKTSTDDGLKEALAKVKHKRYSHLVSWDEPSLMIAKEAKNQTQGMDELLSWCKSEYEKGYQGKKTLRWQRAWEFCNPDS